MARYHFHCADGSREPDEEGTELASDEEAQRIAIVYAGEVLMSNPASIWEKGSWRVEVTNDDNALLFTVITLAIDAPRPKPHL